jgi:hypothetical protein
MIYKIEKKLTPYEIMNMKLTTVDESIYNCIQLYFIMNIKSQLRRQGRPQEFNIVNFKIEDVTDVNCTVRMDIEL